MTQVGARGATDPGRDSVKSNALRRTLSITFLSSFHTQQLNSPTPTPTHTNYHTMYASLSPWTLWSDVVRRD
jgi:hypothetical protein